MIARIRRWIRRHRSTPTYDATTDPVVVTLREIRAESLTASRESNTALRRVRSQRPSWPESAVFVDRERGTP